MDVAAFEEIETGPPVLDQQVPVPGVGDGRLRRSITGICPQIFCLQ